MDEFEQRKREVLQPIYFEAGAALFDCQTFEYGVAYLLYLLARLIGNKSEEALSIAILEDEEKKTAGQLIKLLKKQLKVEDKLEASLTKALKARNRLIHRYLVENVDRFVDPKEHNEIVKEISSLRSEIRKTHQQLKPYVKTLAKMLDGINIDEFTQEAKNKFMSEI